MSQTSIVADFNRLAASFAVDIPATFEGTRGKAFVFPSTSVAPPRVSVSVKPLKVVLRSIRAPKFSIEYMVDSNNTVFSLKERLVSDPNSPLGPDHPLSSIKLLLKAKALSDVKLLGDLPSTEITVMLSSGTEGDNFVPSQVYWGGPTETGPALSEPAASEIELNKRTEPQSRSPQSSQLASTAPLLEDLKRVLVKHGRQDLIDQVQALV